MKYHTLGSESKNSSSGFTLYADIGVSDNKKISYTENDMKKVREQLELVQKDLKLQTKRCRYLVAEYTRRLQEKEQLYRSEKTLRDTQLAKVLKALLIFEARLRQEQKLISHQLSEKDYTIKRLLANQYCRNCNQYYASMDSSSEYVVTESSNMESLDSSSDTYGKSESDKNDEQRAEERKAYFEVLKIRNESSLSNDDNTSADYDNLDSLPPESISDKISVVSESIENMLNKSMHVTNNSASESSLTVTTASSSSESCPKTVIDRTVEDATMTENKLTEVIPVFESGTDTNDNWYASASDQEDDDQRNVYRNNPVLECMNQILLQNINDINSPPKTPNIERKSHNKSNKRVKFSDEEERKSPQEETHNYYETPIQNTPNFYETPQSIYSNDYEQILSKSSETSSDCAKPESTHYIEMEQCATESANNSNSPIRKSKILRTPPALPPKPPNLVSKCKIQTTLLKKPPSETAASAIDTEPDYCSISELNLPQNKVVPPKKISVVAEVHQESTKGRINTAEEKNAKTVVAEEDVPNMVVKKCVEKLNIQLAKNTSVPKKKIDVQIPKLPQVSEIIIPDDPEETDDEPIIAQDNYVKNKTQIMQGKKGGRDAKGPIVIGSSVSSLISGFNNRQIIDEIKRKHERKKATTVFSSFENLQNADKHTGQQHFENFDLSQNFEEFKLDDCEIEEYDVEEELEKEEKQKDQVNSSAADVRDRSPTETTRVDYIRAKDMVQPRLSQASMDLLKKQLELQRSQRPNKPGTNSDANKSPGQPTYEHFLECRGLSSKSLLTPARILTNHKHMLKPKDVKLRSKVKANTNGFNGTTTMRYWSEPFV